MFLVAVFAVAICLVFTVAAIVVVHGPWLPGQGGLLFDIVDRIFHLG